jgi:hypothetical protein
MQIVLNKEEEAAIRRYAVRKYITYDQALKRIIDAMTDGLMNLIKRDENELKFKELKTENTKIKALDNSTTDSNNS